MDQLKTALQQLHQHSTSFSTSSLTTTDITALMAEIRRSERALTSIKIKIGQRSDRLAAEQDGPGAAETFAGTGDVSNRSSRTDADRSQTANDIPEVSDALDEGSIGGEHIDALSRARKGLDPELQQLFDQCAGDLLNRTTNTPVDAFNKQVRRLVDRVSNDHGLATAQKQRAASEWRTWIDRNGMGQARGQFDLELLARLTNAIAREAAAMARQAKNDGEELTFGPHLDALALIELVSHGNGAQGRPDITVIVDANTILNGPHEASVRETVDGRKLAFETIRRLCCDAQVRTVRLGVDGKPIDVGRQHRTATPHQWAALKAIYSSCAWNQCDRPVSWCQAHHITEWEHGGLTNLDNLLPLCGRHHHAVHEGQWAIKLLPDRTLRIFRPDGRHHANASPNRLEHSTDGERRDQGRRPTHN